MLVRRLERREPAPSRRMDGCRCELVALRHGQHYMLPLPLLFYVALLGTRLNEPLLCYCLLGAEQPPAGLLNPNRLKLQHRVPPASVES
jgi:hypothetical protein